MKSKKLDLDTSFAIKGIAILMMLFHHLFRNGLSVHTDYNISYFPFPEVNICNLATMFKICVSLFAFVSGYGLYLNYKSTTMSSAKWVIKREIKLLSSFWGIVLLCWGICQAIDGYTIKQYFGDGLYRGIANMVIEFFGCANLFGTPTLNVNWWYMSAGVVFIFLVPLIVTYEDKILSIVLIIIAIPRVLGIGYLGGMSAYSFVLAFVSGMIFAKYEIIFKWLNNKQNKNGIGVFCAIIELIILLIGYKFYRKLPMEIFWEFHFCLYPLEIIVFCIKYIVYIPIVRNVLIFMGRNSAYIYIIHAFILLYLRDFIYEMPHFIISYIILLGISLIFSSIIRWLEDVIAYNRLINKVCESIEDIEAFYKNKR